MFKPKHYRAAANHEPKADADCPVEKVERFVVYNGDFASYPPKTGVIGQDDATDRHAKRKEVSIKGYVAEGHNLFSECRDIEAGELACRTSLTAVLAIECCRAVFAADAENFVRASRVLVYPLGEIVHLSIYCGPAA